MRCGVIYLREEEEIKNGPMVYKNLSRLKIQRLFSWVRVKQRLSRILLEAFLLRRANNGSKPLKEGEILNYLQFL